jgi:hypothetical protein
MQMGRHRARRYRILPATDPDSVLEQQESIFRLRPDQAPHRRNTAAHSAAQQQHSMLADVAEADAAVDGARASRGPTRRAALGQH